MPDTAIEANLGLLDVTIHVEVNDNGNHLAFLREGGPKGPMVLLLQSDLIDLRDFLNTLPLPVRAR